MKFTNGKKVAAALGAGAIAVAGSGVAYAYWTGGGTGDATSSAASSGGAATYVVTFNAAALVPGGTVPISYAVYNGGATSVQVSSPAAAVTVSPGTGSGTCTASMFTVTQPTQTATIVPAGTTLANAIALGSGTLGLTDSSTDDQNACKGASITVTVTSS